jgi:signal transduction histidine kinase
VSLKADPDQLEQLLINLLRNAVEAVTENKSGAVMVSWSSGKGHVEIAIQDEGPGIASMANIFVPFFTTNQGGSGIGLALSRQIAEAHGGSVEIRNRADHNGCVARVKLPLE